MVLYQSVLKWKGREMRDSQEGGEMGEQRQAAHTALATCSRLLATAELPGSFLHACSSFMSKEHNLYGKFHFNILIFPG